MVDTNPVANSRYTEDVKAARKAAKKSQKAATRAKREGNAPEATGQKPCGVCERGRDLLIRCQTDESKVWRMVCGKCWRDVSGGMVDGDGKHPHYRYGGLWKNRTVKKLSEEDTKIERSTKNSDDAR